MNSRDMTEKQFLNALNKHGMVQLPYMGYVRMPDKRTQVSRLNGGDTRRAQLAYLLREWERIESKKTTAIV